MSRSLPRPAFHVTPPSGWINDPLGLTWHQTPDGGRYELFVQYNPAGPEWVPACRWARLTAPDLVRWSWAGIALEPAPGEEGCWSGAVAVTDDGVPVIVYTSVLAGALEIGRVALAHGDPQWRRWTPDPGGPVLPGPPSDPAMSHFRDPFVWRADEGWRMVVGGGTADGHAAALQYSSPDLRSWRFDGVVADRSAGERAPLPTGSVWECVQLFPLEGSWVLLVSVWADGSPQRVACAVGDYDGGRFTPRSWQPFTATEAVYASTTFVDASGRRCAVSWVREAGPAGGGWAGELSVPVVLSLAGDRVCLAPHPDVDTLRGAVLADTGIGAGERELGAFPPRLDVALDGPADRIVLSDDGGELLALEIDDATVTARRPGRLPERIGGPRPAGIRLLLDGGLAEVFADGDCGVLRLRPPGSQVRLRVSARGRGARARVHEVRPAWPA